MTNATLLLDLLVAASALGALSASFSCPETSSAAEAGLVHFISNTASSARTAKTPLRFRRPAFTNSADTSPRLGPTYTVTATGYEAVPGQTDDEPFVTADNSRIKPHYTSRQRWMALSRDLLRKWGGPFEFGDKVSVRGISPELDGVYTVHDTMNKRHHHCMDVLVHPAEKLAIFTKGVRIQRLRTPEPGLLLAASPTRRRAKARRQRQVASTHRQADSLWQILGYPATAFQAVRP